MTPFAADVLILDTSVVVDIARNNPSGQRILERYALRTRADRPVISVITAGEMLGIAKRRKWKSENIDSLRDLLSQFVMMELTPEVVEAYSDLVAHCNQQRQTMGQQNDMWIAATAKVTGAVLLTGDSGFNWLNSNFIRVEYIPRVL